MSHKIKWWIFHSTMSVLLFGSCKNHQQSVNHTIKDSLIVGKWQMVEYAGGRVNTLDTLSFYKNEKANCPPEIGEFTYGFITSDSLIIYNRDFGESHYKILKLSGDNLIMKIR